MAACRHRSAAGRARARTGRTAPPRHLRGEAVDVRLRLGVLHVCAGHHLGEGAGQAALLKGLMMCVEATHMYIHPRVRQNRTKGAGPGGGGRGTYVSMRPGRAPQGPGGGGGGGSGWHAACVFVTHAGGGGGDTEEATTHVRRRGGGPVGWGEGGGGGGRAARRGHTGALSPAHGSASGRRCACGCRHASAACGTPRPPQVLPPIHATPCTTTNHQTANHQAPCARCPAGPRCTRPCAGRGAGPRPRCQAPVQHQPARPRRPTRGGGVGARAIDVMPVLVCCAEWGRVGQWGGAARQPCR